MRSVQWCERPISECTEVDDPQSSPQGKFMRPLECFFDVSCRE
jgi:hypothetical protein